jgi:hypothetical protein
MNSNWLYNKPKIGRMTKTRVREYYSRCAAAYQSSLEGTLIRVLFFIRAMDNSQKIQILP